MYTRNQKVFIRSGLLICLFISSGKMLFSQDTTTNDADAYAALWTKDLIIEYHSSIFNLAATSIDHSIVALHNLNGEHSISKGWLINKFRISAGAGLKFAIPIVSLDQTFRPLQKAQAVQKTFDPANPNVNRNINPLITSAVSFLRLQSDEVNRLSSIRLLGYFPYVSLSFGRINTGKNNNPIQDLLFVIQYGNSLNFTGIFDKAIGTAIGLDYRQSISLGSISVLYVFNESERFKLQALSGFSYSLTSFSSSFSTLDTNFDFSIAPTSISLFPADSQLDNTGALYSYDYITDTNSDPVVTTTTLRHSLYLFHIGIRGELEINLFSIYFIAKLSMNLYNNYNGSTDLGYIVYKSVDGGPKEGFLTILEQQDHHYTPKTYMTPSILLGMTLLKSLTATFEFSLLQSESFISYLSVGIALNVAL